MKRFVSHQVLGKVVKELQSRSPIIGQMREVSGHVGIRRDYVDARLRALASPEFLGGQGHEWTPEFPSDNEIVLHSFSVWTSRFLEGRARTRGQAWPSGRNTWQLEARSREREIIDTFAQKGRKIR
jgi:hypothetical protein